MTAHSRGPINDRAAGLREAAEICKECRVLFDDDLSPGQMAMDAANQLAAQILARATAAEKSAPTEDEALADEVEALTKEWRGDIADRVVIYREQALRIIAALRHKEPK